MKNQYFLFLIIIAFQLLISCSAANNSCSFSINPDVSCRICDEKSDGTKLIEYFNSDTNELKLFIKTPTSNIEIEHPFSKIEKFNNKIDANKIEFDKTNSQLLIVNESKFSIVKKE